MNGFPNWAPQTVIRRWEELGTRVSSGDERLDRTVKEALYRMLTWPDMRELWTMLDQDLALEFVHVAIEGIRGPIDLEKKTPKEFEIWSKETIAAAKKLSAHIRHTQLDHIPQDEAEDTDQEIRESGKPHDLGESAVMPGLLTEYLEILVRVVERKNEGILLHWDFIEYLPETFYARPNAEFTRRKYFVRKITDFFSKHYSGKRRKFTAFTTSVALDIDPPITERQVRRLAP